MRIVSLLPSATEILFTLGRGEEVVAVSHECDYPPEARALPRATASRIDSRVSSGQIDTQVRSLVAAGEPLYQFDRELIVRLAPDLLITQSQCDVCAVRYADVVDLMNASEALAATEVLSLNSHSVEQLLAEIQRIGNAADAEEGAQRLVDSLSSRIEVGRAATSHLPPKERPLALCLEWLDPPMAAGHWTPQLVAWAGGESCLATTGRPSPYVDWQAVSAADPEIIVIACCGFDLPRSQREAVLLGQLPHWRDLHAVRTGRVFVLDGNAYLTRCGPRLVDTLELFARWLQPSIFGPPEDATLEEGIAWSRYSLPPRD